MRQDRKKVSEILGHHRGTMIKKVVLNRARTTMACFAVQWRLDAKLDDNRTWVHTNPKDSEFLIKDENLKKLAVAEAEIINDWFNEKGGKV